VPDTEESIEVFQGYASRGFDLITAASISYAPYVARVARQYRNSKFLIAGNPDRGQSFPSNVFFAFGRIEDSRFVTGYLAGLMTTSNQLGYIAAFSSVTEVVRGINAFYIGAKTSNPNVVVRDICLYWTFAVCLTTYSHCSASYDIYQHLVKP